jgi:flagellar P-ring protein precursor FlgI
MNSRTLRSRFGGLLMVLCLLAAPAFAQKAAAVVPPVRTTPLGNLVQIEGMRENQLIGYGLVVGLQGSGDSSQIRFQGQSVSNMLRQFGVTLPERGDPRLKNVATVMVSATFPPGYRRGQTIDVTVSSMGDAKSLRGGVLLLTPLLAADGEVYALAQGNVVVGGFSAQGQSGSSVTVNTPTAGRVPSGATVEREIPTDFDTRETVTLSLRRPHFQTATNIVRTINGRYGEIATTRDATSVDVVAPANPTQRVAFVAELQRLGVQVGQELPRVVFNSRTGTVVIADGVRVRPAAVAHGNLKVIIGEQPVASQPAPFGRGETVVLPQSSVVAEQDRGRMFNWAAGSKLQDIVDTINSTGASPDDLMAILQALDQAGAIDGELIVI